MKPFKVRAENVEVVRGLHFWRPKTFKNLKPSAPKLSCVNTLPMIHRQSSHLHFPQRHKYDKYKFTHETTRDTPAESSAK